MANEQDKTKVLYDAVSKDYNIGTFDEFKSKLQDENKRKAFYNGVGKEYNLGTYDEFSSKVSPVKKKEPAQPSTGSLESSRFLQEKPTPTTTIPYRPGAKERLDVQKELEPQIKKQKEVIRVTELLQKPLPYQQQNLPDFNLNKPIKNPIELKVNKINNDIESNKLKALEGKKNFLDKRTELDVEMSKLQSLKNDYDKADNDVTREGLSKQYDIALESAKAKEAELSQLKTEIDNTEITAKKLEKGLVAIKSMGDDQNSGFVNSINNFYNEAIPKLVKGAGTFIGAMSDIASTDPRLMFGTPDIKTTGDYVRDNFDQTAKALSIYVDDEFKNKNLFEKDANGDYANLKSPTAWANFLSGGLGSMTATIGAGLIGGAPAAATVGTLQIMPDIYEGAKEAGLNNQEAALFSVPLALGLGQIERLGAAPFIKQGARKAFYKQFGIEMASNVVGKKVTPELIQSVMGNSYKTALDKVSSKLGNIITDALPEAGEETLQSAIEGVYKMGYDATYGKGKEKGEGAFGTTFKDVFVNSIESGVGGAIIALPYSSVKNLSSSQKREFVNLVKDASNDKEVYNSVIEGLDELKANNEINQGQYNQYVKRFNDMVSLNTKIPPAIDGEARLDAMELVKRKDELVEQKKVVDSSFYEQIDNQISDIDTKLKELATQPTKPVTPPTTEVTLPEVEVTAEKPAQTEPIEAQKVEVKEEPKEIVAEEVVTEEKPIEEVAVKEEEGKKRVYRAEQIANTLGGEVVGSATRKGAIPNDFDIYIENKIDFQSMKNKMESLGYKSIGASPVVDTSGKPFAGENQTAFHFINNKGQKVDVFQEETSEDYFKRVSKPTEVTAEATPIEEVIVKETPKPKGKEGFTEGKDLNKIFAASKAKYGEKEGAKYNDVANRLVNPNTNTIIEVRSNGVVVKDGDKYLLKPFTNTDANYKKWELGKGLDVTEQFEKGEAPKTKAEEAVPEGEKKKTTKVSDFLRENLTTKPIVFKDKDGNEIIVARQGLDWNDMVNKVADLIDKGYEAALAVKEYLKSQDWFKSLNKDQQDAVIEQSVTNFETSIKEAEKGVKEFTKEVAKTIKDLSNNIDKLKQKVTDAKSRIESIKEQGKKIKEWINANRKELKGLTDAQFVNLSKKLTDANLQSDINKIIDYLNKSLSNADYNDKLSQAKKLNKDLKKLAKRPTTLVNESEALKRLASIPPSSSWDIDKLNEYNAFAQGLIDSVGEARNKKGTPDRTEKPITTEEIDSRYDKLKSDYDNDVFNKLVEDNEAYFMAQGKGLTPADLDKIKKDLAELNGDDLKKQEDALARLEQRKEFKEAMKQIVSEQVNKVLNLDRSQFTERQNSIIDGLKNIDLEKANTRSLIELNNVLNNIETNGDFSNAGRAIEAEARSQEANKESRSIAERFKLFKFKTDNFWNLVRTKRSFDAIMQRLTLKSADAQAKLNVALGDTDLSRSHVKVRKFVDTINQTIDKYIKKNKPSVEDIHTLGTVYRLIQNSGIGDVDKQDQFNQIKEDFKASIENLKKGTEKEKALGELQQKIYDKLDLDNVNNQKELIDNFSKINPKGMEIINNLIKEYSKIEPLFRENQELYNNTTYTPLENYLPIQNKTLKSKQTTDLETSDDFSRNSMGINKSLSKSSIKRVGLNRSNQYMNTDFFNVVSKKAVDVANQAYTLADRVAIEKTINSDEFQETFGEDNASVLRDAYKAKVDHIMNIYPMQGEINKFAQALNKISSAGAVRAIGGALQSIKQPVVLVNTAIQLAQNGNADLIGKALKIYLSKDEGFRKMLDSEPISLRETTKAGTAVSSEVDTVAESELKKGLTELYKKFNLSQEEIANKVLVFLKKGDTFPAELSWAAYYMESLRNKGIDVDKIDWEQENNLLNEGDRSRKEALAYAEAMVSNKQNVSDPANISKVIGSKDAWFQLGRSLLAPLSSYSFNTRNRLNDDFLALARGGDRKEATKDIIATAAEMYAYLVVSKTLYSLLLKPASDKLLEFFGFDPEKDPREWDEIIADIAKNKAKYGLLADFISTGTTVFGEEAGKRLANSVYKAFNDEEPKVGEYANMTSEQWMDYWKEQSDYERTLPFREKPIPDILSGGGTIGIMGGMGYNAYEALNYVFDDQNRFEQTQRLGENTLEGVKTGDLVASSGRTKELTDKEKEFFVLSGIFGTASFVMPMLSELTSINRMAYQKAIRQAKRKYGEESERKLPTGFYTKYQELQDKRMKVSQDKSITSREQNEKLKEIDKELDRIEKQRAGGQEIKPKK